MITPHRLFDRRLDAVPLEQKGGEHRLAGSAWQPHTHFRICERSAGRWTEMRLFLIVVLALDSSVANLWLLLQGAGGPLKGGHLSSRLACDGWKRSRRGLLREGVVVVMVTVTLDPDVADRAVGGHRTRPGQQCQQRQAHHTEVWVHLSLARVHGLRLPLRRRAWRSFSGKLADLQVWTKRP